MPTYRVEALVVGAVMPTEPVNVFDWQLDQIDGEPEWTLDRTLHVAVDAPDGMKATSVTAVSPLTGFRAYHRALLEIEAATPREAQEAGEASLERLVGALGMLADQAQPGPAGQVRRIHRLTPPVAVTDGEVPLRTGSLIVGTSADSIQRLAQLGALAGGDPSFSPLLSLWARAERSHREAFDGDGRARAVLAYAQVMEAVASSVKGDLETGGDAEMIAAATALRDDLDTALKSEVDPPARAKTARAAAESGWRKIQSVRLETAGQQMRAAGQELGLDDGQQNAGKDLWNVRSSGAGHPGGPDVTVEQLIAGGRAASVFLRRYIDWRIAQLANAC